MTIQEIIEQLTHQQETFPQQAVIEAIKQQETITPELLRIVEYAASNAEAVASHDDSLDPLFAIYLLAQFREKRAYFPLVNFITADFMFVDRILGDILTEDMGRILASVCDGDISLICGIIENPDLNEFVRCAGLDALLVLVAQNIKTREEILEYFRSLFNGKLESDDSFVWSSLVCSCCDIYAKEVIQEIEQSFNNGLVDTGMISRRDVKCNLAEGKEKTLARLANDRHNSFIDDTVREMSGWHCFKKPSQSSKSTAEEESWQPAPDRTEPKVGRNDPCPCGSGKKHKKCCG